MELDAEKFKAVKELAAIQVSLAESRAALNDLAAKKEEYLQLREGEAHERIVATLRESGDLLENLDKNYHELVSYGIELRAFAQKVSEFSKEVVALSLDLREHLQLGNAQIEARGLAASQILKRIEIERIQVAEDRKQLKREEAEVIEKTRFLASERGALDRAWRELETKK